VPGLIDKLVQVLDERLEDEPVASIYNMLYSPTFEVDVTRTDWTLAL
jgi:hypothetical protein